MLDILFLQMNIQKEFLKMTKKLPKNLVMMELSFLYKKKLLSKLKEKIVYALMYLVMKIKLFLQFLFQIKNLKIRWIYLF